MEVLMSRQNLKAVFDACANFVSKDSIRPVFHTVQMNFANGVCVAYALDGCKLISITVPYESGDECTMQVPIIKLPKCNYVSLKDTGTSIIFDFGGQQQIVEKPMDEFIKNPASFLSINTVNLRIGFEPKLLRDALDSFKDENYVVLNFDNPLTPCLIEGTNKSAVVYPCRIKE